jgi:hypothetical protein
MNCACVLDADNKVIEMCGAHWEYVRKYVAPYTPPQPSMENMLMAQSTQRLQYIHCLEGMLEKVRIEFKDGYCFNRMDEAQRALRNIYAAINPKEKG